MSFLSFTKRSSHARITNFCKFQRAIFLARLVRLSLLLLVFYIVSCLLKKIQYKMLKNKTGQRQKKRNFKFSNFPNSAQHQNIILNLKYISQSHSIRIRIAYFVIFEGSTKGQLARDTNLLSSVTKYQLARWCHWTWKC